MERRLVINADDFGFTRDVNDGIIEAHRRGVLTSTTLMANGAAFDHAVELALHNASLDVGCHLTLIGGHSVLEPERPLPSNVPELLHAIGRGRIDLHAELAAQTRKIVSAGIPATHLDTHKHTHLAPPVLGAVARVSSDFGIPWVRRPFDLPLFAGRSAAPWNMRAAGRVLPLLRRRFDRVLREHGCRTTDYFAGFLVTGRFHTADLADLIRSLPEGTTEFMCHPGYCTDELRAARTRLKESRERELEALTAPETRQALREAGVELLPFSEIW
jgi:chitin disaccharide deacetylase